MLLLLPFLLMPKDSIVISFFAELHLRIAHWFLPGLDSAGLIDLILNLMLVELAH